MKLVQNSIGISDILARRDCRRRFSYGMRRHTGEAQQSDQATPEAGSWATGYGSAAHLAIEATEQGETDEAAIAVAWKAYGDYLEPEDVDLLRADLATYHTRDFPGTRTVASEDEFRVPLLVHEGEQIYFRFKLDRVYELLAQPGHFIHIDYKSSKWRKTSKEVHQDVQLWAYNWGIHEYFPEVDELEQIYDQLRFGQEPTHKSDDQRRQIREWLVQEAVAVLEDDEVQEDGLLPYSYNRWCRWCPILESCGVVADLTDFALTTVAEMAPMRAKLLKDGVTEGKRQERVPLSASKLPEYAAELQRVMAARGILERFEDSVKGLLREAPAARRAELGYELRERKASIFSPRAVRALHERLGDRFYDLVKVTKTGLETSLDDEELRRWALALAQEVAGSTAVYPSRDVA